MQTGLRKVGATQLNVSNQQFCFNEAVSYLVCLGRKCLGKNVSITLERGQQCFSKVDSPDTFAVYH